MYRVKILHSHNKKIIFSCRPLSSLLEKTHQICYNLIANRTNGGKYEQGKRCFSMGC